jgi:hypothetical protein
MFQQRLRGDEREQCSIFFEDLPSDLTEPLAQLFGGVFG